MGKGRPGNHVVYIRVYRREWDGVFQWTKQLVDSPAFIIGGINGQAMYANDVVTSVLRMFQYESFNVNLYVNGAQSSDNGSDTDFYIELNHVGTLEQITTG